MGHHVFSQGIKLDHSKIEVIFSLPSPKTKEEVRSFLGNAGYYRHFIDNFIKVVAPLFKFLMKDVRFKWTKSCQQDFDTSKAKMAVEPILRGPNWAIPFHIFTDAFDTAIGGVLGQKEDQSSYAIYFISKNLSPTDLYYTVTEREFLAVVYAINKFRHYITGYEVFIHTEHFSIRFLMNKPITNGRVIRWLLLLQEFNIIVMDHLGRDSLAEDFLSHIEHDDGDTPIDDIFPHEHLFLSFLKPLGL